MLPQFSWDATRAKVDIDVLDRNDAFVNGLQMRAQVTSPGTQAQNIELEQIAPGRYSGDFAVPGAGRYYLSVSGEAAGVAVGPRLFGLAVPYSSVLPEGP